MLIKSLKDVKKVDSIRVFVFGDVGVGKSTLLATLINFFVKNENNLLVFERDDYESSNLIMLWLERLKNGKFPPITRVAEVTNLKIGLVGINDHFKIKLVLQEMSGEDLKKIGTKHGGDLGIEMQEILKLSDVILTLVPFDWINEQELLIAEFFNYLYAQNFNKPVALVITKWDLAKVQKKNDDERTQDKDRNLLENVIKKHLSWPLKFLQVQGVFKDPQVFYFTVGSVDKDKIITYSPEGLSEIANWIITNSTH